MDRYLDLSKIGKTFDTDSGTYEALRDISLQIRKGEFISLIGHSGCGKSTLMNIIAGLERATAGGAILEGKEITEPGPDRAVVFQSHALMPWLSVFDNVALAVDQVFRKSKTKAEKREWIHHNLELVQMLEAAEKMPHEISGGMKQRVGIARCLAMQPKVVLMDEPFGALDALTRAKLQDTLMNIQAELTNTVVMITHDVDEAVLLSDRIVMMSVGPAARIARVLDVNLARPRNRLTLAEDDDFNHCRHEVLEFLYSGRPVRDELTVIEAGSDDTQPAAGDNSDGHIAA